mgnify:CR=1 FL=1
MNHPDCIIIYTPGDGQAHMVGAQLNLHPKRRGWLYSKWVCLPEAELNDFLAERLEDGFIVVDERAKADQVQPGMSVATPIVAVRKGFDLMLAAEAMQRLHQAILDTPEE